MCIRSHLLFVYLFICSLVHLGRWRRRRQRPGRSCRHRRSWPSTWPPARASTSKTTTATPYPPPPPLFWLLLHCFPFPHRDLLRLFFSFFPLFFASSLVVHRQERDAEHQRRQDRICAPRCVPLPPSLSITSHHTMPRVALRVCVIIAWPPM